GLRRVNAEKSDFESTKSTLSNTLIGETPKETTEEESLPAPITEPLSTSLPEPPDSTELSEESPVVVYVKNVDKPDS
ncbi:MAG TPA: hypothetical protein VMW14_01290, partial [Candidatus Paceibacterota bacterium]|nr:hypothetical protein [Candidatus Paceibacterota bacterium]